MKKEYENVAKHVQAKIPLDFFGTIVFDGARGSSSSPGQGGLDNGLNDLRAFRIQKVRMQVVVAVMLWHRQARSRSGL